MERTVLSTKGQVALLCKIRERYGWLAGQKLIIEETAEGIVISQDKSQDKGMSEKELAKFIGCLKYKGPPKTINYSRQSREVDGAPLKAV